MHPMIPAKQEQKKFRPAFYVTKLEGEYPVTVYEMVPFGKKTDKDGNPKNFRLERKTEMRPRGYLITVPKARSEHNHSIHVADMDEMRRMGFDQTEVPLIEADGGEVVGSIPNNVRKEKVNA